MDWKYFMKYDERNETLYPYNRHNFHDASAQHAAIFFICAGFPSLAAVIRALLPDVQ